MLFTDDSATALLTCAVGAMFFDTKTYARVLDKNICAFYPTGLLSKSIVFFVIL